jgi:hypothetical protein
MKKRRIEVDKYHPTILLVILISCLSGSTASFLKESKLGGL